MLCNKCGVDCVGFPTGDPEEDICSDCAFPGLRDAAKYAAKRLEERHFDRTGESETAGALMRKVLGM